MLFALLMAMGAAGGAGASDARHDEKLAMAAARIAAERMGELRGSFSPDGDIAFVKPAERPEAPATPRRTDPRPGEWEGGLAIAVERPSSVSPDL